MRGKILSALAGLTLAAASITPAFAQLPRNPRSVLPQNFQNIKLGEYNQLTQPEVTFPDFYNVEVDRFFHEDAIKLDPKLIYPPIIGPVRENPCRNGDLESGIDSNEWDGGFGSVDGVGNIMWGGFATGIFGGPINLGTSRQTWVNYALDPNAPIYMTASSSSNGAVRIGNTATGNGAELLSKTFTVTSSQSLITFSYAMVLQSPMDHPAAARPSFRVRVVDVATNTEITGVVDLGNGSNIATADNVNPFFQSNDGGRTVYRDWSCAQINLSKHVGRRVTVQFITTDCAWGAHWGYAYLDNFCGACDNGYNFNLEKVDCDRSTFCFKYRLPRVNNVTGSLRITMYLYQNGILKDSVVSPVLTSDSLYCFTLSPTTLASLDPSLGGYDVVVRGNFAISGSSLAPIQLFTAPEGMRRGLNNDCDLIQVAPCCPGRNLIVNGGFESGNTGFTSQYGYQGIIGAGSVTPTRYSILTDAQALAVSSTWNPSCSAYNRHFVANGLTGGTGWKAVWMQAVSVTPGKTYKFCGDFKNLPQCSFDIKPVIGILNSGTGFGGTPTTSQTINVPAGGSCNWTRIEQTITATTSTIYLSVCLRETGAGDGNDFAMDNLSLVELQPVSFMDIHFNRSPFNITSSTYNMSISAVTPLPSDCQHFWQVEELDVNFLVVPGTTVTNPLPWQPLSTNTFIGYVGTSTLSGSAPGLFSNNKIYRFAYGRSCKCLGLSRRFEIYGPAFSNRAGGSSNNMSSGPQLLQSGYLDEDGNVIPSGIDDPVQEGVKIYPNPTTGNVTVQRPVATEAMQIKVYNLHGQVVKTMAFGAGETKMSVSLSEFASGAYMLQVVAANGTIVHAEKVTKQ